MDFINEDALEGLDYVEMEVCSLNDKLVEVFFYSVNQTINMPNAPP